MPSTEDLIERKPLDFDEKPPSNIQVEGWAYYPCGIEIAACGWKLWVSQRAELHVKQNHLDLSKTPLVTSKSKAEIKGTVTLYELLDLVPVTKVELNQIFWQL